MPQGWRQKVLIGLIIISAATSFIGETQGVQVAASVVTFVLACLLFWLHRTEEKDET